MYATAPPVMSSEASDPQ